MARNQGCTIYVGNLDEKVTERVLYEILIQVGPVVDLHMPRDKETNKHKGYAFAEYETEEIANYAIKLFSGLVRLHNKTVKFAMSGQDKPFQKTGSFGSPSSNNLPLRDSLPVGEQEEKNSRGLAQSVDIYRTSSRTSFVSTVNCQASSDRLVNRGHDNGSFEYSRRVFGAMVNTVSRPSRHQSPINPIRQF